MKYSLLIILGVFLTTYSFSQNKEILETKGLKSAVVTEQKFDGSASRTYKDSETYYDRNGNIIEEIIYKDGKVDNHFKYQYDANGNKIKEIEYNSDGKVKKISDYKYQGNLRIEKTVTDAEGKLKSKKIYKYEKY